MPKDRNDNVLKFKSDWVNTPDELYEDASKYDLRSAVIIGFDADGHFLIRGTANLALPELCEMSMLFQHALFNRLPKS